MNSKMTDRFATIVLDYVPPLLRRYLLACFLISSSTVPKN